MRSLEHRLAPEVMREAVMLAFEDKPCWVILDYLRKQTNDWGIATLSAISRFKLRTTGNRTRASRKPLPRPLVESVIDNLQVDRRMDEIIEDTGLTISQIRRIKREAGLTKKYRGLMDYMVTEDSFKSDTRKATRLEFLADVRLYEPWEMLEKYPKLTAPILSYWRDKIGVAKKRSKYTPDEMVKKCREADLILTRLDGQDMLRVTVARAAHVLGIPYWTFRYHIERSYLRRPTANELRDEARAARKRIDADVRREVDEIARAKALAQKERENAPVFEDEDDYAPDPTLLAAVLANEDIE